MFKVTLANQDNDIVETNIDKEFSVTAKVEAEKQVNVLGTEGYIAIEAVEVE